MTSSHGYGVSIRQAAPRTIAAVEAQVPLAAIPATFARYLDQVYAAARAGAVHLDGQNVFLYRDVPGSPGEGLVAFGVGVIAPFTASGPVTPVVLPAGEVATTTHRGSYATLRAAHEAVIAWCRSEGRDLTGPRWEVYGHWTADESQLQTDVFYMLR
ncbi:MAG TPA: GyrI-like domain-containing protein [Vicinamibacterales bacterium]